MHHDSDRQHAPIPMRTLLLIVSLSFLAACGADAAAGAPRVYVALDQEFSEPLLNRFAKELGIDVAQQHDTEATKTIGLVSMIREEAKAPRCTVFWNNELAHTVALAQQGLLEPYDSPAGRDLPAVFVDKEHRWHGFAARARILIVNTKLLPDPKDWPKSYADLVDPKWKGRCAIAKPLKGTTWTHMTAMWQKLGDDGMDKLIDGLFANDVQLLDSNGATMRAVRDGNLAWSFTDTDDFHVAKLKGFPVACVFPDQQPNGIGTMLIPNSVGLVKGGPNQEAGKRLIDKILSRDAEALLAAADSAQIPLRDGVPGPRDAAIKPLASWQQMQWDPAWTGENLGRFHEKFGKRFGR